MAIVCTLSQTTKERMVYVGSFFFLLILAPYIRLLFLVDSITFYLVITFIWLILFLFLEDNKKKLIIITLCVVTPLVFTVAGLWHTAIVEVSILTFLYNTKLDKYIKSLDLKVCEYINKLKKRMKI